MDWDYRVTAKSYGLPTDKRCGTDMLQFPIEKARLRSFSYPVLTAIAAVVGYGWSIEAKAVRFLSDEGHVMTHVPAHRHSSSPSTHSRQLTTVLFYRRCNNAVVLVLVCTG